MEGKKVKNNLKNWYLHNFIVSLLEECKDTGDNGSNASNNTDNERGYTHISVSFLSSVLLRKTAFIYKGSTFVCYCKVIFALTKIALSGKMKNNLFVVLRDCSRHKKNILTDRTSCCISKES